MVRNTIRFIATEMFNGTLKDLIHGHYKGQPFGGLNKIIKQVSMGLAYLHEKKIVHRDLKPSNVYISSPIGSTASPVLKLANFWTSRNPKRTLVPFPLWKLAGSKSWAAPEVYHATGFSITMDLYSLGLIYG